MPTTTQKPKKKFVSKAQKIRDLEALAAPDSGATDGERANALEKLAKIRAEEAKLKADQDRWSETAKAKMSDPGAGAEYVAYLGDCPNLPRYSFYNTLLLAAQCEDRGIPLRSVDTFKGWQARGRQVRKGEGGLWMCVHGIRELTAEQRAAGEREDYFYFKKGWFEVSQTDPIGDGDEPGVAASGPLGLPDRGAADETVALILASLVTQIERAGYVVKSETVSPGLTSVTRDAEAQTVTIANTEGSTVFDGLLLQLGEMVAAIAVERQAQQQDRKARPAKGTPDDGLEVFAMNW